jgi:hypothetical protein
VPTEFLEIV